MLSSYSRPEAALQMQTLIQSAGFRQPTPLQKAAIPLAIQQKDLIVESNGCRGKTVAIVTSAILQTPLSKNGLYTLILAGSRPDMQKLSSTAHRISVKKRKLPQISCIGIDDNIGREVKQLKKQPSIIIGSSERLIDHIRRGNIQLEEVKNILINYPANTDTGFDKDILYIFSKLPKRHSTALFCSSQPDDPDLLKLLKKPHIIGPEDIQNLKIEADLHVVQNEKAKVSTLTKIILANHASGCIILTGSKAVFNECRNKLSENGRNKIVSAFGKNFGVQVPENGFAITDNPAKLQCNNEVEYIFVLNIHHFHSVYSSIQQLLSGRSRLVFISTPNESDDITNLEEKYKMKMNSKNDPGSADLISEKIKAMVKRIRTEEDPELMDWYKKIIKKNVPIHLRSYIGAYLLKENSKGLAPSSAGSSKKSRPARQERTAKSGDFTTLFISIGKNRRVFPRDLSGMLCNTLEMGSENIGPIKVLDNYSFVEIKPDYAQKAIDKLNGSEFRGRTIKVDFAKKR